MSRLAVAVPFHAGEESVPSFCSRVAVANGAESSRSFAMHMGIRFRSIALGERSALNRIAKITGVEVGLLATSLATKDENEFSINGEVITAPYFNRTRFRYCPACLAEDVSTGRGPVESRPFGRLAWQVSFIRSCHLHETALAVSDRHVGFDVRDDFSSIWRSLPVEERTASCRAMRSTDFEKYVLRRLGGSKLSEGWSDDMPLYVVGHLSETIGAAALFGKWFSSRTLTDAEWHAAGDAGFGILKSKKRLAGFLDAMQDQFLKKKRNNYLGQALYGTLFRRLDEGQREDSNFDTVRDFIREHANRTLPFGPDDQLFGRMGLPRRLHSIKTAAAQAGLGIKLLRSHLLHAGLVTKSDLTNTPHRVFIDAGRVNDMLEKLAKEAHGVRKVTVEEKAACEMLGVGRDTWNRIASTFCLREKPYARVARRTVDDFLEKLRASVTADHSSDDLLEPASAAIACTCQVADVLQLVLSHKLKTVALDDRRDGIAKFLVDRSEVRVALRGDEVRQHLKSFEVADLLRIDVDSLSRLARSGVLPRMRLPDAGRQFYYSKDDIREFNRAYASTSRIADVTGASSSAVTYQLRDANVSRAFGKDIRGACLYSLADLVGIVPQPAIERLQDADGID